MQSMDSCTVTFQHHYNSVIMRKWLRLVVERDNTIHNYNQTPLKFNRNADNKEIMYTTENPSFTI